MLLLLGCAAEPEPAQPLDVSWVANVALQPARFASTLTDNGGRDAWIAFHRADWLAVPAESVPGKRAQAELERLETVLWWLNSDAVLTFAEGWRTRSPDTPMPAWLAPAAQRVAELRGNASAADRWRLQAATDARPYAVDQPAVGLVALRSSFATPLNDAVLGSFWDPTRPLALQRAYAVPDEGGLSVGLQQDLFGPITEAAMGAHPRNDVVEDCRAFVQAMDARLDPWAAALATKADADGKALLTDLDLVAVGRSRTLVELAFDALSHDRATCALYYAEQAVDHGSPRVITPVNTPTVFAVLAAANFKTGHVRESLDALTPLRPTATGGYPEVLGVIELVGDVAVQQGLDRAGVSREH